MCVTPELYVTPVVVRLMDHLIVKSRQAGFPSVFDYLAVMPAWAEYTLYWLFLRENYSVGDYYTDRPHVPILGVDQSVWVKNQFTDVAMLQSRIESTIRNQSALFMAIQSSCVPFADCYEAIRFHLE